MNQSFIKCSGRILAFTNALVLLAIHANLRAEEFIQIKGEITQTNYDSKNRYSGKWSFPFTCVTSSNVWRIDDNYSKNGKSAWDYDGTNVYRSLQISRASENSPATILISPSPGGHPLGDLGVNLPWLAFCSGTYLKRPERDIPLPVADVHEYTDSLSCTDKTEIFDDVDGLPSLVELFTSRSKFKKSLDDDRLYRNSRLQQAKTNSVYTVAENILRFRYVVSASTNFNARHFPTEFRYYDYRLRDGGTNWSLVSEGIGQTKSIGWGSKPENVFVQGRNQTVLDMRFRHKTKPIDAIIYQWTNAVVPSADDPVLRARMEESGK